MSIDQMGRSSGLEYRDGNGSENHSRVAGNKALSRWRAYDRAVPRLKGKYFRPHSVR